MQHASVAARYQLGGMAGGALVGYGTTGSIDGALMGASFGQMGGSIAAHFAVACFTAGTPFVRRQSYFRFSDNYISPS
ncbi:MAG: hypothetical protein ACOVQH_09440, partial [Burkholderiaceae bacterium]